MKRKLLLVLSAICVSASVVTACGGAGDNGNAQMNNVNGYSQQRNNGAMNNGNGVQGPTLRPSGYEDNRIGGSRDVGSNGVGVSGTSNNRRAADDGMGNN
ncbi:hypothetical protein [Paenibacillus sp.]|uniref:hypothetical protein n=1 Tax=Paenibacillus sp. TaxID=58172 RepID=UPI002D31FD8A|nr:hypothetical protein [Paenibacillus sp.]HZG86903.1 hypothetical protein [Paenibacillus sp.]